MFNVQTGATIIALADVAGARPCWTEFLNLIPIFPNSFAVTTRHGEEHRFVAFGRQAWIDALEQRATSG